MKIIQILIILSLIFSFGNETTFAKIIAPKPIVATIKTYQKKVIYKSPGGDVTVTFTVQKDTQGIIKSVKTVFIRGDKESGWYVKSFGEKIGKTIIGKNIKNLSIQSVGGASLTTKAFSSYIRTIK
jgi:hypothetical protein